MVLSLCGEWKLKQINSNKEYVANIPSCNYVDLLKNNVIKDPFVGTNEKDLLWVAEQDWLYTREFDVNESTLKEPVIVLCCKQLDTLTEIKINDNVIAQTENCHISYEFDIKQYLKIGKNIISILFYSPVKYAQKEQERLNNPNNCNGINGIANLRKPQCHFGWDWGPILPPSGITGNIYIETKASIKMSEFKITQNLISDECVEILVNASFENVNPDYKCKIKLEYKNKVVLEQDVEIDNIIDHTFVLKNPKLWWPNGLSKNKEQPLYSCSIIVLNGDDIVLKQAKNIGIRSIKLNRSKDSYGENFQFIVNGEPIFVKGANWIPADSFITNVTIDKLELYIKAAVEANFNMIRVWGGGYYESDEFYDLCDKYGILIWQDFCFACQPYPFFEESFLNNVKQEVIFNVKRLREHPSLAIWNGNNEIEAMSLAWTARVKYVKWTEKFFYHVLPELLTTLDDVTPYIPGSPCGTGFGDGISSDNVGDTHLWAVWHGLQPLTYYRKRMTRFCSEFGFESLPDKKTIEQYAKPEDYSLDSEVFNSHQKCLSGNKKMIYYIASRFSLPKNFEDYIYLSQICQSECVRDATEHWRRNKGRCNGSMYWQFNDCWPVCSWAGMDYYNNYKALQYNAKHFNSPICVSFNDSKNSTDVYVLNDTLEELKGELLLDVIDFNGVNLISKKLDVSIDKNTVKNVITLDYKELSITNNVKNKSFMVAKLVVDGLVVSERTLIFKYENKIKFPKVEISVDVKYKDNKALISLTSAKFARFVSLYSGSVNNPFSDNYFDLIPGETKVVEIDLGDCDKSSFEKTLAVKSLADVKPQSNKLIDDIKRLRIFLIPANFFGYIAYKFM